MRPERNVADARVCCCVAATSANYDVDVADGKKRSRRCLGHQAEFIELLGRKDIELGFWSAHRRDPGARVDSHLDAVLLAFGGHALRLRETFAQGATFNRQRIDLGGRRSTPCARPPARRRRSGHEDAQ